MCFPTVRRVVTTTGDRAVLEDGRTVIFETGSGIAAGDLVRILGTVVVSRIDPEEESG